MTLRDAVSGLPWSARHWYGPGHRCSWFAQHQVAALTGSIVSLLRLAPQIRRAMTERLPFASVAPSRTTISAQKLRLGEKSRGWLSNHEFGEVAPPHVTALVMKIEPDPSASPARET